MTRPTDSVTSREPEGAPPRSAPRGVAETYREPFAVARCGAATVVLELDPKGFFGDESRQKGGTPKPRESEPKTPPKIQRRSAFDASRPRQNQRGLWEG
jgi:hypothetical protein